MSTLKTKKVQLGDNADPSKNFLIEVPAVADGTLTIKRGNGTNVLSIDATGKAVIPGVVGTVAQVGGIPTGQVVERGSNANGQYVRFADGTQICTTSVSVTYPTGPTQTGWTFPAAFSHLPSLDGRFFSPESANHLWGAEVLTTSVTDGFFFNNSGSTRSGTLTFLAVGRWF